MYTELTRDDPTSHPELATPEEPLQRLVVDFEDLVDWAAELAPQVRRVRDASQAPYVVTVGLTAILAVAVVLLMTRARL